jgi:hypothetical protein
MCKNLPCSCLPADWLEANSALHPRSFCGTSGCCSDSIGVVRTPDAALPSKNRVVLSETVRITPDEKGIIFPGNLGAFQAPQSEGIKEGVGVSLDIGI